MDLEFSEIMLVQIMYNCLFLKLKKGSLFLRE